MNSSHCYIERIFYPLIYVISKKVILSIKFFEKYLLPSCILKIGFTVFEREGDNFVHTRNRFVGKQNR